MDTNNIYRIIVFNNRNEITNVFITFEQINEFSLECQYTDYPVVF